MSLSNSPSSRGGCAEPAGDRTGSAPGRGPPCFPHEGRGGRASGLRECGAGWTHPESPGGRTDPISCRKEILSPYHQPQVPPVQGIVLHPVFLGFFFGTANVPGRAKPSPCRVHNSGGGGQNTPAASFLHARPPPGAGSEFLGCPEFPHSQPPGPLHSHRDRGWGCFPAVASAAGAGGAPAQEASLVTGRLSAGCSSFLPWSRGLCGLRVMRWKAPESLER